MDRRKRALHSRASYPVGAIRVRWDNKRQRCRFIKVRADGPKSRRWVEFARWWWERNKGPVPPGMRVIHLDGDQMNDDPANLELGTPADVAFLWHERNPAGSARNYAKCRAATAEFNRESARLRRLLEWLPTRWYPVDHARRVVHNRPVRKRWQVFAAFGVAGDGSDYRQMEAAALGWPGLTLMQAAVLTALTESGELGAHELKARVGDLRRRYGWGAEDPLVGTVHSTVSCLRRLGLVLRFQRKRGVYRPTQEALSRRGPVCPVVPMRGRQLAADGCFCGYEKLTPEEPPVQMPTIYKCPHCGREYSVRVCKNGQVPVHVFEQKHCPGSLQVPRNAASDMRPLWKDLKPEEAK